MYDSPYTRILTVTLISAIHSVCIRALGALGGMILVKLNIVFVAEMISSKADRLANVPLREYLMRVILLVIIVVHSVAANDGAVDDRAQWLTAAEIRQAIEQLDTADAERIIVRSYRRADSRSRIACVAGLVHAPVSHVWEAITDYARYDDYIPRCSYSTVLDTGIRTMIEESGSLPVAFSAADYAADVRDVSNRVLLYSEIDIVFPVGRIRSVLEFTADTMARVIYWRKLAADVREYDGAWLLLPFGEHTAVICVTRYRLNVWLPPVLIHSAVHCYFPQIVVNLRRRVESPP